MVTINKITGEALERLEKVSKLIAPKADYSDLATQTAKEWLPEAGTAGDILARRSGIPEVAQKENIAAIRQKAADESRLTKYASKIYENMSPKAVEEYEELIAQGQAANFGFGKWVSGDELDFIPIEKSAKEGYKTYRALNDLDYMVTNENIRNTMIREGFKGSSEGYITKEVDSGKIFTKDFSNMEIRVAGERNGRINSMNSSAAEVKENYLDKGYHLYEIHPYTRANEDLNYNYILDKNTERYENPISQFPLHYSEGGIRSYQQGELFVKMPRATYGQGKSYWGVKTVMSGDDPVALGRYADEVNEAMRIWKEAKGDLANIQMALDEADFKYFKVKTAKDLNDLIRSESNPEGLFDANFKAGVYQNKEMPLNDSGLPSFDTSSTMDTARADLMKLSSRYYKGRGQILNNINNDLSHLERSDKILEQLARRIAYGRNIDPLIETQGEYFKKMFADVVDTSTGLNPFETSGKQLLLFAPIKRLDTVKHSDRWKVRAARHMQNVMTNLTNVPTLTDQKIIERWNDFLDSLNVSLERWWDPKYINTLRNKNPLRGAQAAVFNMLLGFFNPAQLWKQGQQVVNFLTLYPTETMEALSRLSVVLPSYMARNSGDKVMNAFRKIANNFPGFSAEDLDNLVKYMEQYGTFNQTSNRPEVLGTKIFLKNLNSLERLNLVWFSSGTNISNLVCDVLAYGLAKDKKNFKEIAYIADSLNFNATRANASAIQRNPLSAMLVGLQTYSFGVFGAVFGKNLKGLDTVVKESARSRLPIRIKFLVALLAMWGISGVFDRDTAPMLYNALENTDAPQIVKDTAIEGALTTLAGSFGYDVREGPEILSAYKSIWSVVSAVTNRKGETPDIPMTGLVPMMTGLYGAVKDTINPKTSAGDIVGWLRMLKKYQLPSGISNTAAGLYALFTKKYIDKYGRVVKDNMSDIDSIMSIFGVRPIEAKKFETARARDKLYKESIDECIENYIKPLADQEAEYMGTNMDNPSAVEAIGTLRNELDTNTRACKKAIEDNLPEDYLSYFNYRLKQLYTANPDAETGLTKYQRAILWRMTGEY